MLGACQAHNFLLGNIFPLRRERSEAAMGHIVTKKENSLSNPATAVWTRGQCQTGTGARLWCEAACLEGALAQTSI